MLCMHLIENLLIYLFSKKHAIYKIPMRVDLYIYIFNYDKSRVFYSKYYNRLLGSIVCADNCAILSLTFTEKMVDIYFSVTSIAVSVTGS